MLSPIAANPQRTRRWERRRLRDERRGCDGGGDERDDADGENDAVNGIPKMSTVTRYGDRINVVAGQVLEDFANDAACSRLAIRAAPSGTT